MDGDIINLFYKHDYLTEKKYLIEGAVNQPGRYTIRKNSNIYDSILEAGGISPNVNIFKIEISRMIKHSAKTTPSKVTKFSEIIDFGVFDHSSFSIDNGVLRETNLENNDIIHIRNTPNYPFKKL